MFRTFSRRPSVWMAVLFVGCASADSSCGGCAAPVPGGYMETNGDRTNNAITAKVSRTGLTFFETQINQIVNQVSGGALSSTQVPCTDVTQTFNNPIGIGPSSFSIPVYACDHSDDFACSGADNNAPQIDEQNSLGLRACEARVKISQLKLNPTQATAGGPVKLAVQVQLRVNTGSIPIDATTDFWPYPEMHCAIEMDSNASGAAEIPVNVDLTLTVDPNTYDVLAFDVGQINLSQIFDPGDLRLASVSGALSVLCDVADVDFVKDLVFNFVKGRVEQTVYDIVDQFRCRACETRTNNCPQNSQCVVDQGVCYSCTPGSPNCNVQYNPSTNLRKCPPTLLGMESRVGVGDLLGGFGAPSDAYLDLYAVAGGKTNGVPDVRAEPVGSDPATPRGIVVGIMGGTRPVVRRVDGRFEAPGQSICVPPREWAERIAPPQINFDTEAAVAGPSGNDLRDYHLGLAVADNFIDKTLFDVYTAGLLCLNVDSSVSTFLSSSLFRTFLGSLGVLTQGQDVPMLIALRPHQAPEVVVGKGTYHEVNGELVPDDPLLTVNLKDLTIDIYALIEERQVRLFSMKADLALPLSLEFDAENNTVRPLLADLGGLLTNVTVSNADILAPGEADLIPNLLSAVIDLIQPALASVLAPIELPTLQGFRLSIREARGSIPVGGNAPGNHYLTLFANLGLAASPYSMNADTDAAIVDSFVPDAQELRFAEGRRPYVTIEANGEGLFGRDFPGYEYSYRVDGGLWSEWLRSPRFTIQRPGLVFEGRHTIEIRSRGQGDLSSVDPSPVKLPFLVDYTAPNVALVADEALQLVRTEATDGVARLDELSFRYRLGRDGAWSAPGAMRPIAFSELPSDGVVAVEVTDPSGHVTLATWGGWSLDDARGEVGVTLPGGRAPLDTAGGCTQAAPALLALLGLFGARRRRTR